MLWNSKHCRGSACCFEGNGLKSSKTEKGSGIGIGEQRKGSWRRGLRWEVGMVAVPHEFWGYTPLREMECCGWCNGCSLTA